MPTVPSAYASFYDNSEYFSEDLYFSTGKKGTDFGRGFPVPVTSQLMQLGREKYDIFCAVCHGETGAGDGVVPTVAQNNEAYGYVIASLLDDRIATMPEGQIFNTITHGFGNMLPYGTKLTKEERWAIVAYVRALERATRGTIADIPPAQRKDLGL